MMDLADGFYGQGQAMLSEGGRGAGGDGGYDTSVDLSMSARNGAGAGAGIWIAIDRGKKVSETSGLSVNE